jgi:fluoride exporter
VPEIFIQAGAVAAGALVGAPARHALTEFITARAGPGFPWGTLVVNVSGAFAIGVLAAYAEARGLTGDAPLWLLLGTGVLGSYTTVSAFTLQTLTLAHDRKRRTAFRYIALSFVLCLAAVALGHGVTEALL